MKNIFLLLVFLNLSSCSKSTLLDDYKNEISALKTEAEIDRYWNNLLDLDQKALEKDKYSVKQSDSISITHMIKTALMFEIHGSETYKINNIVPEMNLSHNYFGTSSLAFWPIIKKCVKARGELIQYPAYQLECITGTLYDYSVYSQREKHQALLNKLNEIESCSISEDLFDALNYQSKLNKLKVSKIIGKWQRQPFENLKEDGLFDFVKMSDGAIYYRKNGRLQKLVLIKSESEFSFFRIENEPFGWYFKLDNKGDLSLIDN